MPSNYNTAYFFIDSLHRDMTCEKKMWDKNEAFNPLSPHDALKHHFTSLKTDLIFLQLGVLE